MLQLSKDAGMLTPWGKKHPIYKVSWQKLTISWDQRKVSTSDFGFSGFEFCFFAFGNCDAKGGYLSWLGTLYQSSSQQLFSATNMYSVSARSSIKPICPPKFVSHENAKISSLVKPGGQKSLRS